MSGQILLILRAAMALALYGFLAWAFLLIWQDLKRQSLAATTRLAPALTVSYQEGEQACTLNASSSELMIGRDPACDCALEDQTVSAHHTRLYFRHGQWWVEDLQSTNGTFLNQEPVTTPLVLTNGDELGVGQVLLTVRIGD